MVRRESILRTSSYTNNGESTESLPSYHDDEEDVLEPFRRLSPPSPQKPVRRNVGKVERRKTKRPSGPKRSISFSEKVQEQAVEKIPRSKSNDFFYGEEEIARFRHDAFLEEAGLDPEEFPFDG